MPWAGSRAAVASLVRSLVDGRGSSPEARLEADLAQRFRAESFPFVSGDTFRSMSQHVIDETGQARDSVGSGDVIFVATKYARQFMEAAGRPSNKTHFESATVILHNGDKLPEVQLVAEIVESFGAVWSVNPSSEMIGLGVVGLPIGLENLHWGRSGVLKYFPTPYGFWSLPKTEQRSNMVFASFRESTNPGVRKPLRQLVKAENVHWREPDQDVAGYFDDLRNSTFSLSPQGNGLDCHRTWEALYLGSVPVVLQGTLDPSLVSSLPILEVADWNDFLGLSNSAMLETAQQLSTRSRTRAYMPFWCARLLGAHKNA